MFIINRLYYFNINIRYFLFIKKFRVREDFFRVKVISRVL